MSTTATEILLRRQQENIYLKKLILHMERELIHPAIKIAYKIIFQQAVKEKLKMYELKMIKTL